MIIIFSEHDAIQKKDIHEINVGMLNIKRYNLQDVNAVIYTDTRTDQFKLLYPHQKTDKVYPIKELRLCIEEGLKPKFWPGLKI